MLLVMITCPPLNQSAAPSSPDAMRTSRGSFNGFHRHSHTILLVEANRSTRTMQSISPSPQLLMSNMMMILFFLPSGAAPSIAYANRRIATRASGRGGAAVPRVDRAVRSSPGEYMLPGRGRDRAQAPVRGRRSERRLHRDLIPGTSKTRHTITRRMIEAARQNSIAS